MTEPMQHANRPTSLVRHAVGALFAALAAGCPLMSQAESSLDGVWRIEKPVTAVRTIDGKEPPLRPEAAKLYREHIAQRQRGDTAYDSATWCASVGMPRIMLINSPFELVVSPPYVAFLHEWNWWARTVYLDGVLSEKPKAAGIASPSADPPRAGGGSGPVGAETPGGPSVIDASPIDRASFNEATGPVGLSRGKFVGDTLVIETSALRDSTLIDNSGLPHSDALMITERLRLRSADVLENRLRIEDPEAFTQPWETVVTYRRQQQEDIREDVCLDRIRTEQPAVPN